jgi:exopolysaccharide biosynthesis WecB/TagA/CpsF family protein
MVYPRRKLRKVSGSDLIYTLADHASKREERVFLLGADEESNRGTIEALKKRWPALIVEGYAPPFCENIHDLDWNEEILGRIASFGPTQLVVCFGPVKQETWISQNADRLFRLGVRCAYGLGGTLDFVSGRKRRAPKWIQAIGAEWFFRFLSEPTRRLGRTAKMFKMPYFAYKFYNREVRIYGERGVATNSLNRMSIIRSPRPKSSITTAMGVRKLSEKFPDTGNGNAPAERYVTISVDDGHPTDLRTLDLLQEFNLKATFYVPCANDERPVMTPYEIREIDRYCEVGGHTLNHVRLTWVSPDEGWREICDGKKSLEDTLGREAISFCYPGGKFNRRIEAQVKAAGFLAARTCKYFLTKFPTNPFNWGVSTYANTYQPYVQVRHALLESNFEGCFNYLTTFQARTGWGEQFQCALDQVAHQGGIAHLYFHSWEIDQNDEWDELRAVFQAISQYPLTSVTNGEIYRRWYEKRGIVTSPTLIGSASR